MEMIAPMEPTSPWKHVWDIQDFVMFFTLEDTDSNLEAFGCGDAALIDMESFSSGLNTAATYDGNFTKFQLFRDVANHIMNGYPLNIILSDLFCRSTWIKDITNFPLPTEIPFLKVLLYRFPWQFINNLSTCDKRAYFDTTENIDAILPYINDVSGTTFIKGEENGFLTTYRGFEMKGVQNNYFFSKLRALISSGLYFYWKTWFKNTKHKGVKLFQYYGNWTGPSSVSVVQKPNFSSKIVMTFYLYGILSIVCLVVFVTEVSRSRIS